MRKNWRRDGGKLNVLYLDANVFIFAQVSNEREGTWARLILKAMEDGKFKGITNVLAIDEVVWKIGKEVDYSSAIRTGEAIFNLPNLEIVEVTPDIIKEAFTWMKKYKMKPRDAIHVASMIKNNVFTIITEDVDFKGIKEIKSLTFSEFLKKFG
jgi:predicted nucleic acid-binding protein